MLANMVLWNIWHPGRFLPEDKRVYLAQDGETEVLGPGWEKGNGRFWEDSGFAHLLLEERDGEGGRKNGGEGIEML